MRSTVHEKLPDDDPAGLKHVANIHNKMNDNTITLVKDIPVTGHGGPHGCEPSRLRHFLDNWLTDDGEAVSLMCRPLFTSRKIPGTHFC
jgi:hypothetical protein